MKLTEKQNEFIREANHRYNFKIGAVRSGKTYGDMAYTIPSRIRERAGKEGLNLILGVSKETIERNVLEPMREIYTKDLVGTIKPNNKVRIFGEEAYCLGAEKINQVGKIQGASLKYCYGDEITRWNKEVFEMLKSRLDKEYSCMDGACNPDSPEHWLKKDFIDKAEDLDVYLQHYTIFDNPMLPASFVKNLCKEYEGTVYYGRYIDGEWTQAEGLCFPNYLQAIAECPYILDPDTFVSLRDFQLSIDYGTMNAFACLLWVKIKNTWWAWRGYYYSGRDTGVQKTDSEYCDAVCDLIRPVMEMQKQALDAGRLGQGQKMKTIVDPSAASFIAELRKRGWFKVIPADNDVSDGIRNTNTAIKHDVIKINSNIKEWKTEAGGYIWDEKNPGVEQPVKENDHYMDATRYFVKTNGLGNIKDLDPEEYLKYLRSARQRATGMWS